MSELGHLQGDLYFRLSEITLAWAQDLATRSICLSGLLRVCLLGLAERYGLAAYGLV